MKGKLKKSKTERRKRGLGGTKEIIFLCPTETLKHWRYGGSFLEGIESIEIAFFQQANFMGILKRNILWRESNALDG